jgi:hypothetical protein
MKMRVYDVKEEFWSCYDFYIDILVVWCILWEWVLHDDILIVFKLFMKNSVFLGWGLSDEVVVKNKWNKDKNSKYKNR